LEYVRDSTEIVDNYRIELAWDKTLGKLNLQDSVQHMMDKFNEAEIVKVYEKRNKEMEDASDISMIERCSVPRKVMVPTCKLLYICTVKSWCVRPLLSW